MSEQKGRIDGTEWGALIIFDAGRYDGLQALREEFEAFTGGVDLDRVNNGNVGFTANWMAATFDGDYEAHFYHGGQPVYSMEGGTTWDEREHFTMVPSYQEYQWDAQVGTCWPEVVNEMVFANSDPSDRIVVRYLCPHPPWPKMVDLTRGRGNRTRLVAEKVRAGDVTVDEVWQAYMDHYEYAVEAASHLATWSDGTTVLTADHGECLGDCGQWFHGPVGDGGHDPHEHLVDVPWMVVP